MTTWFVTRHKGALQWANESGIEASEGRVVESLDPEQVLAGDLVVGTLPINLAARVIARGAKYMHLALEVPQEARGKELTADEMRRFGARLEKYSIAFEGISQTKEQAQAGPPVMVVIASGQTMPNLLPLLALGVAPAHLFIVVSSAVEAGITARRIRQVAGLLKVPSSEFSCAPTSPMAEVKRFAADCFAHVRSQFPSGRIVLNATGGTKIMSAGFSSALGPAGEIIYCDTANDRIEYFAPEGRAPIALATDLVDLEAYLLAQGQKIVSVASRDKSWWNQVDARENMTRALAAMFGNTPEDALKTVRQLNVLASNALPGNGKNTFEREQSLGSPLPPEINSMAESAGIWRFFADDEKRPSRISFANEAAASYVGGAWLEEYCALTMRDLGVNEAHWGCNVKIIPSEATLKNTRNEPRSLNELDLAVVWRNRLLVIECKTGGQLQGGPAGSNQEKSQDILNKLEAIRNYAAGALGEGWLLNAQLLRENSDAIDRAREYRVALFEREWIATLPLLLKRWMKQTLSRDEETMFAMIERKCEKRLRTSGPARSGNSREPAPPNTALRDALANARRNRT